MCMVSFVGLKWTDQWDRPTPVPNLPMQPGIQSYPMVTISRGEFEGLKVRISEAEQAIRELREVRITDVAAGTPDCQHGDKVALLRAVADELGVDLRDIFGPPVERHPTF